MIKLINLFLIIFFTHFNLLTFGQQQFSSTQLPYPSIYYQELDQKQDKALQANLEDIITNNSLWKELILRKKMALGLVDLRDMNNIRYAALNGKHMLYAASLPKIAVLLSAIEAVDEGCLEYTPQLQKDLRLMIAKSNNAATTRVIESLGFDKIAETMTKSKYELYDIKDGGGLWVGKKYAKDGRKQPDPLKGLSHAATVEQVARFYTMLAYGKLVNEQWSQEMMRYLIDPQINHKFVKTLNNLAPNADVYRKSGSWKQFHSDSVLVFGDDGRKYILVALIEDSNGSAICSKLVSKVELALGIGQELQKPTLIDPGVPILRPDLDGNY